MSNGTESPQLQEYRAATAKLLALHDDFDDAKIERDALIDDPVAYVKADEKVQEIDRSTDPILDGLDDLWYRRMSQDDIAILQAESKKRMDIINRVRESFRNNDELLFIPKDEVFDAVQMTEDDFEKAWGSLIHRHAVNYGGQVRPLTLTINTDGVHRV